MMVLFCPFMAVKSVITGFLIALGIGILISLLYRLRGAILLVNEQWIRRRKIHDASYEIFKRGEYPQERWKASVLAVGYLLVSFALAPLLTFLTYKLRLWTLSRDALFLEHDLWAMYFLCYLFFSLLVMGIPYLLISRLVFPHIVDRRSIIIQLNMTLLCVGIACLILIPFIFLSFDTYTVITKEKFSRDYFLRLSETDNLFSDFDHVSVTHGLRGKNIFISIDAFLSSGENITLYKKSSPLLLPKMPFAALEHIRQQKCIPFTVQEEPSEAFYEYFRSLPDGRRRRFDRDEEVRRMRAVFSRLRAIAAAPCS